MTEPFVPRVIHCKSSEAVFGRCRYVGRGTHYGNRWSHKAGTKAEFTALTVEQACLLFCAWIHLPEQKWLREKAKQDLRGYDLGCWCVTKGNPDAACHAYVILEVAND